MNIKSKLKLLFKSLFTQFGAVVAEDGMQIIWNEEGDIQVGYEVYHEIEAEDGEIEYEPVPDGEYKVGERTIVVAEGKVSEIREEEKPAEEPAEPAAEEPVSEEMEGEGEPAAEPAEPAQPEAPSGEDVTEPIFDPAKEIEDVRRDISELRAQMDELRGKMEELRGMVEKLLEVPAEDDAFKAEKKNETEVKKGFVFKAKN